MLAQQKEYAAANRERRAAKAAANYQANKEKFNIQATEWARKNREAIHEHQKRWRDNNKEDMQERKRKWREANPARNIEYAGKRRAVERGATPPWADWAEIRKVYEKAARLSRKTGVEYHVDHIIPLTSPRVCGLHIAINLQILSAFENQSKHNKWWPNDILSQKDKTCI